MAIRGGTQSTMDDDLPVYIALTCGIGNGYFVVVGVAFGELRGENIINQRLYLSNSDGTCCSPMFSRSDIAATGAKFGNRCVQMVYVSPRRRKGPKCSKEGNTLIFGHLRT